MTEAPQKNNPKPELASPYRSPLRSRPEKQFTFVPNPTHEEDIKSSPRLRLLNEEIPSGEKNFGHRDSPETINSRTLSPTLSPSMQNKRLTNIRNDKKQLTAKPGFHREASSGTLRPAFSRQGSNSGDQLGLSKKPSSDRWTKLGTVGRGNSRANVLNKKRLLRASSTKEFQEVSYDSKDNSDLYELQNYFHQQRPSRAGSQVSFEDGSPRNRRGGEIKNFYYNALRKKMGRRRSMKMDDPVEFNEQVKEIKENIRTPNEMRVRDIAISEKTNMERLIAYKDNFPFLKFRKNLLLGPRYFSIFCFKIVDHFLFDYIILAVVLTNSLLLAMDNPTDDIPAVSPAVDNFLLAIYTTEMFLKIFGLGFVINKGSYLRDPWNVMDFIIVTTAYIPIFFSSGGLNLQAFRVLRVLRPLRTISKIQSLKIIVLTLLAALGPLMETVFVLVFMYVIFGIAGLQLFQGLMKRRCVNADEGTLAYSEDLGNEDIDFQMYCATDSDCPNFDGDSYMCAKMLQNPAFGFINFDNLPYSILMVVQIVSVEGWSDIMYILQKTFSPFVAVYFIVLIMICTFFLLNLTLAVIKAEFTSHSHESHLMLKDARKHMSHDAKLIEKLENNKMDVLKLVKRRQKGEIQFNKYEFKKGNLVAVTKKKSSDDGVPMKRRREGAGVSALGRLSMQFAGFGNAMKGKKRSTIFQSLGSLVQRLMKKNTQQSSATISPEPEEKALVSNQTRTSSMKTPDPKMFTIIKNNKFGKVPKMGSLSAQNTNDLSFAEKQASLKQGDVGNDNDQPLMFENNDFQSPDTSNSPEKVESASPKKNNKANFVKEEGVSFDGSKANSFIAIPSIAEANEQSEQSIRTPTEVSSKSRLGGSKTSLRRKTMGIHVTRTPVRPVISEKVHLKNSEQEDGKVALISIAGIRNKNEKNELIPQRRDIRSFSRVSKTPEPFEYSINDEQSLLDHSYTRFGGYINENDKAKEQTNHARTLLMKNMNHISKPGKKHKAHGLSRHKSSHGMSIIDLSEELDGMHGTSNIPSELLDDSDFFTDKQRYEMLKQRKRNRQKRMTHRSSTRNYPRQGTLIENRNHTEVQANSKTNLLLQAEKLEAGSGKPEKEDTDRYIIDVRHLKPIPNFKRDYDAFSTDDVLPAKHERELRAKEEEETKKIRETRLKLKYRVTRNDRQRAINQTTARYTDANITGTMAALNSEKTLRIRRIREHDREMDEQYSKAMFNKEGSGVGKTSFGKHSFGRSKTQGSFKRRIAGTQGRGGGGGQLANQEGDYLPEGKENDFFEIAKMINQPFENEVEADNPEHATKKEIKTFALESDYMDIRRKDLKDYQVRTNTWSGDAILSITSRVFAIDQVKRAFNIQDYDIWRSGVIGVLHASRRKVKWFIETNLFNNIILLSVFLNTVMLASQGLVNDTASQDLLSNFNLAFTVIFTIEMGLKIIGLGLKGYASDFMNLFDCAIVILSLYEQVTLSGTGGNSAVSAFRTVRLFRTFRVLRVTKLLRTLSYMKIIIGVIMRSMKNFIFILILLFLFIFIYSLLGMQVYGGNLNIKNNSGQDAIRQNFDSFLNAWMVVFQVMTQENWNDIINITLRSPTVNNAISLLYLVSWMCIGNYIFLNLFLAILLDEFTGEEVEEELEEIEEEDGDIVDNLSSSSMTKTGSKTINTSKRGTTQKTLSKDSFKPKSLESHGSRGSQGSQGDASSHENTSNVGSASHIQQPKTAVIACRRSLYIFTKDNIIRRFCLAVIQHHHFEKAILGMIVVSSLKLGVDTFISDSNTEIMNISNTFDDAINIFFMIEMVVKVISLGFCFDGGSYLRDSWNRLDFLIVVTSLIDMTVENVDLQVVKILRLLRTLRPLRFVSHNKSMRLIVTALLESLKPMVNVVIVILLIWLMFAILATNIVGSKMGHCDNPEEFSYYEITQEQCAQQGYEWIVPHSNFDNVFWGMLTLFVLSTMENWPGIMGTVSDANDAIYGPVKDTNQLFASFYFMAFILIGGFFLVNLFVGVIFLEFTRAEKRENQIQKFLTPSQQNWVIMQRLVVTTKADLTNVEPDAAWMKKIFRIINHTYFEIFIMTIIILNIIVMCLSWDENSQQLTDATTYANYVFSIIFGIELILKHMGLGFMRYWSSSWNQFDAFVVLASIFDFVMSFMEQSFLSFIKFGPQLARVFRVLRVSRLFKLVKSLENLQKLINTLVFSLPALLNVGALLFLVYFIYSILGVFLYKNVLLGSLIGDLIHFENAAIAFITLFRCSTGENWQFIMYDVMYPYECSDGSTTSCSTAAYIAVPFWVSFIVICRFIFLNLFILVILQQFEEYHLNPDNPVNKFRETLEDVFRPHWEKYSLRHGGAFIHESQVFDFFLTMPEPLGFQGTNLTKKAIAKQVMKMNIPENDQKMIFYNDMVYAAFKNGFNNEPISVFEQFQYLLKEETKTRKKLDRIKKNSNLKPKKLPLQRKRSLKLIVGGANPILKMLFLGMTMKAWIKYTRNVTSKIKSAEENGYDYIPSESDEDDYEEYSEAPDTSNDDIDFDDHEEDYGIEQLEQDYIPEEHEGGSSDEEDEKSKNTSKKDESRNSKEVGPETHIAITEEKEAFLNQNEDDASNKSQYLESLKIKNPIRNKNPNSRNISPLFDRKEHDPNTGRDRSLSNLTAPKIVMHTVEGEMHNLTPKVLYSFVDQERSPGGKSPKSPKQDGSGKSSKNSISNFNQ